MSTVDAALATQYFKHKGSFGLARVAPSKYMPNRVPDHYLFPRAGRSELNNKLVLGSYSTRAKDYSPEDQDLVKIHKMSICWFLNGPWTCRRVVDTSSLSQGLSQEVRACWIKYLRHNTRVSMYACRIEFAKKTSDFTTPLPVGLGSLEFRASAADGKMRLEHCWPDDVTPR